MRYLYHLTEGNRGPVTFEQLQELAKAGTIDNMTPVLAEGAREWSRWLFIKNTPPAPAPAPAAAPVPAAEAKPAPQKKEAPKPEPKQAAPAPRAKETPKPQPAPKPAQAAATVQQKAQPAAPKPAAPAPAAQPKAAETPQQAPAEPSKAAEAQPAPAAPAEAFSLSAFFRGLKPLQLIPAAVCAVITLLSLLTAGIWAFMAHDAQAEYAELCDMQAAHSQGRADLDGLAAQQQQVITEATKLQADIADLQQKLQLTQEESTRLAKVSYISEAEDKQLKDEQAKAARLKELEQKH